MTRQEKEDLLREAVETLIKLDNHMMTSRDNAEFSQWVEELIEQPKQRTGHWIKEGIVDANGNRNCRCSECGHTDIQAETQIVPYCWWCGAKMQKPQESEDKE